MKKVFCLVLILSGVLTGCGQKKEEPTPPVGKEEIEVHLSSEIDKDKCFICGKPAGGLLEMYSGLDSLGIIHWNDMSVIDTEVREYDEDGKEVFGQDHLNMRSSSFGEGQGSVWTTPNPGRGISEVQIYIGEKDKPDLHKLENTLCQDCCDKVAKFYEDQVNSGDDEYLGSTGYSIIDFATGELYTLSNPYRGYTIRDYRIWYDLETHGDGGKAIDILIVYAPERTE